MQTNEKTSLPKIRQFDGHDWYLTKTYKRNLPHWELKGSTYFITIRVRTEIGKPFLNQSLASFMLSHLLKSDKINYDLQAFVIMPDHLHIIIKPIAGNPLSEIMKNLKGSSSFQLNKMLGRTGPLWQVENFDHLIRDEIGLQQKWQYIKENPVKAKLVDQPERYPYSSFFIVT